MVLVLQFPIAPGRKIRAWVCLLAAILPARHASKMNTVEALRYE